jgi:hypothetical protein
MGRTVVVDPTDSGRGRYGLVKLLDDDPWSGLIHQLSVDCGGNAVTKGLIKITDSEAGSGYTSWLVDYASGSYWHSKNTPNSWVQFDFKSAAISPTHYSLKSSGNSVQFPRQWELTGSNDETTWVVLDRRDTRELDGTYITKTFPCSSRSASVGEFYRYLRLTQTGPNAIGQHYLMLAAVEFFGSLRKLALA